LAHNTLAKTVLCCAASGACCARPAKDVRIAGGY